MHRNLIFFTSVVSLLSSPLLANEYSEELNNLANGKIRSLIQNESVVNSIKTQNSEHASLSQTDIDKLDKQWRSESEDASGPLINKLLNTSLSEKLKKVVEDEEGLFTEIFVMDNRGLNVGQSAPTSDYWQGDEAKWQETYLVGPQAVHISEVEFDESTQNYQAQVSISIADPSSGQAIGAVTFGVNADAL